MPDPSEPQADELAVLSQEEFSEAVRQALRHLARPGALAGSPLTRTRLVAEHPGGDPAEALRELLEGTIEALDGDPRSAKLHRALTATFMGGAPTQELAAERLGLPFTTYRRHLTAGVEHVCQHLWQRELYGAAARA
ncbi:hypothetical protein ACFQQB_10685 [Nonomuraea rubra]|uniref:hypothetical protein n=1 Tax=Nonomuraea rubra TaxID=46180 RepID=UPI00361FEC38